MPSDKAKAFVQDRITTHKVGAATWGWVFVVHPLL